MNAAEHRAKAEAWAFAAGANLDAFERAAGTLKGAPTALAQAAHAQAALAQAHATLAAGGGE